MPYCLPLHKSFEDHDSAPVIRFSAGCGHASLFRKYREYHKNIDRNRNIDQNYCSLIATTENKRKSKKKKPSKERILMTRKRWSGSPSGVCVPFPARVVKNIASTGDPGSNHHWSQINNLVEYQLEPRRLFSPEFISMEELSGSLLDSVRDGLLQKAAEVGWLPYCWFWNCWNPF